MLGNHTILSVLAISMATFFWGISFSSTKILLQDLVPEQIAFLRLVIAVTVLTVALFASGQRLVQKKNMLRMIFGGFTGVFLYFLLENNGLQFTGAGTASLIVCTAPVINVIAGTLFFQEKYSWKRWVGVIMSFVGVYLIIRFGSGDSLALDNLKGNMLIFMAACSWVAFTRINVPLMKEYSSLSVNFHQSLVGLLCLGFLALPKGIDPAVFSFTLTFNLVYLGLFCSAGAYFLYLYALKNLGSTTATTFINMVPVFGVLGGVVILNETLEAGQILGAVTVIMGVSMVTLLGDKEGSRAVPGETQRNQDNFEVEPE